MFSLGLILSSHSNRHQSRSISSLGSNYRLLLFNYGCMGPYNGTRPHDTCDSRTSNLRWLPPVQVTVFPGYDEERTQHAKENEQSQGDSFELRDIGRPTNVQPSSRLYGHLHAIPANIMLLADPVAPRVDIEHQVGEDLFAPSERVFMTAGMADENNHGRHNTVEHSQDQRMHGTLGASMMRNANAVNPAGVECAAKEPIASNIWNKISNQEIRVPRRKPLQKTAEQNVAAIRAVTPDAEDGAMHGSETTKPGTQEIDTVNGE